jgi:hypothetical protein
MSKQFTTYKELIEEKQKLEVLLKAQKELIRYDVDELKAQVKPVTDVIANLKKFTSRDKTELLVNIGSDIAVNTLVKRLILGNAGWLAKLIIPYFMKNFTSNIVAEQKDKGLSKLAHWLNRNKNGKDKHKEKEREEEEHPTED